MKLAFSSNAYLNFLICEAIGRIAGVDFSGIEHQANVPARARRRPR